LGNHLILLGHHASSSSRVLAFAYLTVALLFSDDRKALFVMGVAYVILDTG
jgi:hypothetical protein